jgi:hypothetical protein
MTELAEHYIALQLNAWVILRRSDGAQHRNAYRSHKMAASVCQRINDGLVRFEQIPVTGRTANSYSGL